MADDVDEAFFENEEEVDSVASVQLAEEFFSRDIEFIVQVIEDTLAVALDLADQIITEVVIFDHV